LHLSFNSFALKLFQDIHACIEELLDEVYAEAAKKTYVKSLSVKVEGPILKCRIHFNDSFVNVFFKEVTGTIAFTLMRGDRRIFSMDRHSLRGWHKHPT
jgi:hypothetical protein